MRNQTMRYILTTVTAVIFSLGIGCSKDKGGGVVATPPSDQCTSDPSQCNVSQQYDNGYFLTAVQETGTAGLNLNIDNIQLGFYAESAIASQNNSNFIPHYNGSVSVLGQMTLSLANTFTGSQCHINPGVYNITTAGKGIWRTTTNLSNYSGYSYAENIQVEATSGDDKILINLREALLYPKNNTSSEASSRFSAMSAKGYIQSINGNDCSYDIEIGDMNYLAVNYEGHTVTGGQIHIKLPTINLPDVVDIFPVDRPVYHHRPTQKRPKKHHNCKGKKKKKRPKVHVETTYHEFVLPTRTGVIDFGHGLEHGEPVMW